VFLILILLFIRIAYDFGALQAPSFKPVLGIVFQIDNVLIAPVYFIKSIILSNIPEKIYLKKGFVEPVILLSITVYLIIRYTIEVVLIRVLKKFEEEEAEKRRQQERKVHYSDWNV
ncbi:MAG: hypothetical protein AB1782_05280, partial [Cyanobacteriota bacterium]